MQRGFRQRVRQVIGVQVEQLLVEQVDDAGVAHRAQLHAVRVQRARQHDRRRGVAAPVARQRVVAQVGDVVVLEQRRVVDQRFQRTHALHHLRHQRLALRFVSEVGGECLGGHAALAQRAHRVVGIGA
jgi:hypothetical protein